MTRGLSLCFFLFFTFWVTPWKSAREASTSRLVCFTTGFPGAPKGSPLQLFPNGSNAVHRCGTNDDVARLDFIRQMQGLGFSLTEIRQLLELREHHLDACLEVRDLLKTKLEKVHSKIRELEQLEGELALDLRKCNRELKQTHSHTPRQCPILVRSNEEKREVPC